MIRVTVPSHETRHSSHGNKHRETLCFLSATIVTLVHALFGFFGCSNQVNCPACCQASSEMMACHTENLHLCKLCLTKVGLAQRECGSIKETTLKQLTSTDLNAIQFHDTPLCATPGHTSRCPHPQLRACWLLPLHVSRHLAPWHHGAGYSN